MLKRGVYAASLSVLNKDLTLNVKATISHGENLIKNGCTGVFFMGSTGQAQLCSLLAQLCLLESELSFLKFIL